MKPRPCPCLAPFAGLAGVALPGLAPARSEPALLVTGSCLPLADLTSLDTLLSLAAAVVLAILLGLAVLRRRRAEAAQRATSDVLQSVLQASPLAICTLDRAGKVKTWNPAAEHIFGWAALEVVGDPLPVVPRHQQEEFRGLCERVGAGESSMGVETAGQTKNGLLIEVSLSARPLYDIQGGVHGIMLLAADISERKRAAEALVQEQALLRGLIDSIPDLIFYKNREGVYIGCNTAFEQYAGQREAELIERTARDLFPSEVGKVYQEQDRQVLADAQPKRYEEWFDYPDGRRVLVETLKTPFFGPDGRVLGLIGISRDITERKRLEEQLRQAQKMEAIGQLAGGVAHDFNNLLTAILGNVSLVMSGLPSDDPQHELLRETEKAALRAAELTKQLLGFSRQTMLRLEPIDLNSVIQETVRILRRTFDPRIRVEVESLANLWTVQADPGQMNQVLMNLCLNARDAMSEGGRLRLETMKVVLDQDCQRRHLEARPGEFVRLRVLDTGHGIPTEIRPRIFDPFFTTKGPGKGTGLGLAMVFGILKQHRGWIECYSEVGQGTHFDIYLPRYREKPARPAATPLPLAIGGGTETILLVDDEAIIRNLGRTILQRYGYHVLLAEDGQEAVRVFREEKDRIDLVILDLVMPRLSGRDALRQMLQSDPDLRVLFSSGYSAQQVIDSEEKGVLGFVQKPYRPQDLATMVRSVLDRARTPAPS